ncbi:hypothetical protein MTR_1g052385 [Medicago truncatula]|uniref:Uncharacterized protein n=1 Tax=Medicago truncatula TaxID=3880 RepID=A0A072VTW8_MEDTR|nr:hypothetical protein MTR_1g052385 [Medicago truncatula]
MAFTKVSFTNSTIDVLVVSGISPNVPLPLRCIKEFRLRKIKNDQPRLRPREVISTNHKLRALPKHCFMVEEATLELLLLYRDLMLAKTRTHQHSNMTWKL